MPVRAGDQVIVGETRDDVSVKPGDGVGHG